MGNPPRYGGLDAFKVIAALLVVAIHTSPLTTYSPDGDFLLTRSLARVAVPFFFMVTGQFVLGKVLQGRRPFSALWRQVKKILLLYLVAVVLYLPVGLYAGHYQGLSPCPPSVCYSSTAPFTISGIFLPAPQGCFWCICWGGCCGAEAAGGHGTALSHRSVWGQLLWPDRRAAASGSGLRGRLPGVLLHPQRPVYGPPVSPPGRPAGKPATRRKARCQRLGLLLSLVLMTGRLSSLRHLPCSAMTACISCCRW